MSNEDDKDKTWTILEGPKVWTATVLPDPDSPGDCILDFPEDLVERMGWEIGDTLSWDIRDDGSVTIQKVIKAAED